MSHADMGKKGDIVQLGISLCFFRSHCSFLLAALEVAFIKLYLFYFVHFDQNNHYRVSDKEGEEFKLSRYEFDHI